MIPSEDHRSHRLADAMRDCGARERGTPHGSLQNALGPPEALQNMAGQEAEE